jgi:mlo protein
VSLVSSDGLHQLHIFVFFLAVFHVVFSALTMSLGRAKVRLVVTSCGLSSGLVHCVNITCKLEVTLIFFPMQTRTWKVWENETSSLTYEFVNGNPIFLTCNFLCRPRFSVFFTFTVKLDPSKFRLTRQTSFVRQHASCWNKSTILLYIVCFHGIITSCHCTEY